MRTLDGTGLAKRGAGGPSGGARRGPLAAALLGITLLCCLFGPPVAAGAAPQSSTAPGAAAADFSAQALLARLAVQQAVLTGADGGSADELGYAVAFSGDTALVGARVHDTAGMNQAGAAYVYVRGPGGFWVQEAELTAPDGAIYAAFGAAVALSGDTALVGAPVAKVVGQASMGAAYVFTRSAGIWTARQKLTPSDPAAIDDFGDAVALSGDTALVGTWFHPGEGGTPEVGAAYVFVRVADRPVWIQQAKLTAADGAEGDHFGWSVALSAEAALIGAPGYVTEGGAKAGAAYVFTRGAGGAWAQQDKLTAADAAAGDEFGTSIALSGENALVGAPYRDTDGKADAGAAYVFLLDPVPAVTLFAPTAGPVGTPVTITGSGLAGATAVTFDGVAATAVSLDSDTQVTAAVPSGATSGPIAVTTPGGTAPSAAGFTVTAPAKPNIAKIKPASAKHGATVTIRGASFDVAQGVGFVKFGARKCATYLSWSDAQITCKVPAKAKYGKVSVTVTTTRGVSNANRFTVKR